MLSCFFCCSVTKNRTLIFPLSLSSLLDANNNNNNLLEEGGCGFSTKDQQHFFGHGHIRRNNNSPKMTMLLFFSKYPRICLHIVIIIKNAYLRKTVKNF